MSLISRVRSEETTISLEDFFTVRKYPYRFVIEFKEGISLEDFKIGIEILLYETKTVRTHGYLRPVTYFRKHSKVYHSRKRKTIEVTEYDCRYFISTKEYLCYTQSNRTGLLIDQMEWQNIDRIEMINKNSPDVLNSQHDNKEKMWRKIENALYDDVTWTNLTKDSFQDSGDKFYYISKIFDHQIMKEIEDAFANKKKFRFTQNRQKRDFSVSGYLGDDGIYKAWFSSEYKDSANGDYYLLLNPNLAVFYLKA